MSRPGWLQFEPCRYKSRLLLKPAVATPVAAREIPLAVAVAVVAAMATAHLHPQSQPRRNSQFRANSSVAAVAWAITAHVLASLGCNVFHVFCVATTNALFAHPLDLPVFVHTLAPTNNTCANTQCPFTSRESLFFLCNLGAMLSAPRRFGLHAAAGLGKSACSSCCG